MIRYFTFALFASLLTLSMLNAQIGDDPKKKQKGQPMADGLKALQHPDASVRYRAAETLAQLGPLAKFAVPELRETLKDKNGVVRVKAAEALWKIAPLPVSVLMPVLLQAMKDKDPGVRAAAPPVIALMGAKAKTALPALVEALNDKDFSVKIAAISALGDLGPVAKNTANDLLNLATDKEFFLLEPFVGAALSNMGDGVVPTLAAALASDLGDSRRVAAYALGSIGPGAAPATAQLGKALSHHDPATRKLAARALGMIGPKAKDALAQLEPITGDKDIAVRIEAALAYWLVSGNAKHVGVVIKGLDDKSPAVRDSACQTLALMKGAAKDAVDPVAKMIDDKDLRVRAIITLGEIGPPAAKVAPTLKKLFTDKDDETVLRASFAYWQIAGDGKTSLPILEKLIASEQVDKQAVHLIGEMGSAAASLMPSLVALYREDEDAAFRQAVAVAIKKIDPETAKKLGIR
jgi:HEAT repeat protein